MWSKHTAKPETAKPRNNNCPDGVEKRPDPREICKRLEKDNCVQKILNTVVDLTKVEWEKKICTWAPTDNWQAWWSSWTSPFLEQWTIFEKVPLLPVPQPRVGLLFG
jgi:hypothetical protein